MRYRYPLLGSIRGRLSFLLNLCTTIYRRGPKQALDLQNTELVYCKTRNMFPAHVQRAHKLPVLRS